MNKYIIRLDDACEKRDIEKWNRMELLLDKYEISPLVGIIPKCEDPSMDVFLEDKAFWPLVNEWIKKGWDIAMHGYNHVYSTSCGGINPVNNRSEFAGNDFETQCEKIRLGVEIFRAHNIEPAIFFAPSHTFDLNTINALKKESNISIISDTIAWDVYKKYDMIFVPQQSGKARIMPFAVTTFCYHPNTMTNAQFEELETFILNNRENFVSFHDLPLDTNRKKNLIDELLNWLYFARR